MIDLSISKRLGNFKLNISFITRDELLVLFGPSGSGKTLTLQAIAGFLKPDSGYIRIEDITYFDSEMGIDLPINKRGVGYVLQEYALFPHLTVYENIAFGIHKKPTEKIKGRVEEMLGLLRIDDIKDLYPNEISGGQKQRVAIARALAVEPSILLLDEPLAALDYPVRSKLRTDLLSIHKRYTIPTIFVTHDVEEAFILGGRIAVLNEGGIEQIGTKEEVFYRPRTRKVAKFLAVKNIFDGTVVEVSPKDTSMKVESEGFSLSLDSKVGISIGDRIEFCIRPEDIKVLREDKPIRDDLQENIITGIILKILEKGPSHTIFIGLPVCSPGRKDTDYTFEINIPNSSYRSLGLKEGQRIRISIRRDSVWVIPLSS